MATVKMTNRQKSRRVHGCLESKPNSRTVWFDTDLPLNLHALADQTGLDVPYLSKILNGDRTVKIQVYRAIIKALEPVRKFTIDSLLEAIEDRKKQRLSA